MYAVIHLPGFSLQAVLRHEPDSETRPVVLVDSVQTTPRVCERNARACELGVSLGMTAPQALARCRTVVLRHRSLEQEAAALEAVLQCAYGFSPGLEVSGPGVVTLDLHGLAELRSSGPGSSGTNVVTFLNWGDRLRQAVSAMGLSAWIGMGPTPNVARHAARAGATRIEGAAGREDEGASTADVVSDACTIRPGGRSGGGVVWVTEPAAFVRGLPVEALEPSSHVQTILAGWGIGTVGQLLALGQAELAERLGLEALGLFAAASVTGLRPLKCVRPAERFEELHEFETEVETMEPLLFLLRRFTETLGRRLEALGWVAGVLRLRLRLETRRVIEQELRVPEPTRRAEVLFRMLHTHLESMRTESPVKAVGLMAEPAREPQRQLGLFESALRDPNQFQETLARLAALVGADRVGSPVRDNSHRPDAFVLVPPDFERGTGVGGAGRQPAESIERNDRPTPMRRLRPALPARVAWETDGQESRGDRPVELKCSLVGGRLRVVLGPWRSSGGWWEAGGWEHEEWDVAVRGGPVIRLSRKATEGGEARVDAVLD